MGPPRHKPKILVADDSADDVFFLSHAFQRAGLDCCLEAVPDGESAIDYLAKNPCPDVFLLDLKMPKVNGFEVLQWIKDKSFLKGLPVVVISSSDLPVDKERATNLGATAYFVKRADFESLVTEIDTRFFRKH